MINLENNYFIDSDGTQFILKRNCEAEKKDTKEKYIRVDSIGYYSDLNLALQGYVRELMLEDVQAKTLTINEVKDKLDQIYTYIRGVYKREIKQR